LSFFDGSVKKEVEIVVIRPPYYKEISYFEKECVKCDGKCSKVCNENILKIGEDKLPFLDFTHGGCTYCDKCATSCDREVLDISYKTLIEVSFTIDTSKCMSYHKSICFSCKEPCLENAIKFKGMFEPHIDTNLCTSCGFCLSRCPSNAINFESLPSKEGRICLKNSF